MKKKGAGGKEGSDAAVEACKRRRGGGGVGEGGDAAAKSPGLFASAMKRSSTSLGEFGVGGTGSVAEEEENAVEFDDDSGDADYVDQELLVEVDALDNFCQVSTLT